MGLKGLNRRLFLTKVDVTPHCWTWQGASAKGYGRYSGRYAHVVAYEVYVGPVPAGLELDHLCRNGLCVNPAHLDPVTHQVNMDRRYELVTHCWRGHEFTSENTYFFPGSGTRPRRSCRACWRINTAAYKARRRAS